jgi:hypothetical protein
MSSIWFKGTGWKSVPGGRVCLLPGSHVTPVGQEVCRRGLGVLWIHRRPAGQGWLSHDATGACRMTSGQTFPIVLLGGWFNAGPASMLLSLHSVLPFIRKFGSLDKVGRYMGFRLLSCRSAHTSYCAKEIRAYVNAARFSAESAICVLSQHHGQHSVCWVSIPCAESAFTRR